VDVSLVNSFHEGRRPVLDQADLDTRPQALKSHEDLRQGCFDELRGASNPKDSMLTSAQSLRPLAERFGISQQPSRPTKQFVAVSGQNDLAADPIEQPDAQLLLEISDLPRQGWLGPVQSASGERDASRIGDGHEVSEVPELHGSTLCL
jgi:hypothetical protein